MPILSIANQSAITVAILTRNRIALLQRCVEAVLPQVVSGDEILILDTGSTDGTVDWLASQPHPVRHLSLLLVQLDFAEARNTLVQDCITPLLVFTDDDGIPAADWLSRVRANLAQSDAVGGPCAAGKLYDYPWWWTPGLNWTIGNSPPGVYLRLPDNYPDTSNMAAPTAEFISSPFGATSHALDSQDLYLGGREDSQWWQTARVHGKQTLIDPRQLVFHYIDQNRLTLSYIMRRAKQDGAASWQRGPHLDAAWQLPRQMIESGLHTAAAFFRRPWGARTWMEPLVWSARQVARYRAARASGDANIRSALSHSRTAREAAQVLREKAASRAFSVIRFSQCQDPWPAERPSLIYVSGDCHLGDTVLLRPHLQQLASTFPDSRIHMNSRFPELLTGLHGNVSVVHPRQKIEIQEAAAQADAAIVPYYLFGDTGLWRRTLARKAATFDCDVAFPRQRDYVLARRTIAKNLLLHETENLHRLFSLWPLIGLPYAPPLTAPDSGIKSAEIKWPALYKKPFVTIQFGGGYASKEWPLSSWIPCIRELQSRTALPIVLIGTANWQEAGDIAMRECGGGEILNLIDKTDVPELMAILSKTALLIGSCSGPKHIAFAMRTPTFTLYGPTEPERWGATSDPEKHAYIKGLPDKLTADELAGLPEHHRILLLTPEAVATKIPSHLERLGLV